MKLLNAASELVRGPRGTSLTPGVALVLMSSPKNTCAGARATLSPAAATTTAKSLLIRSVHPPIWVVWAWCRIVPKARCSDYATRS